LNNFQSILKLCKTPLDKLTLRIDDYKEKPATQSAGEQSQVGPQSMLIFMEDDKGMRSTEFHMKLVSFSEDKFSHPKLRSESMICLRTSEFSSTCRDFAHLSPLIGITVIDKGIKLSVKSDFAQGSISIQNNDIMDREENKETSEEKVMLEIEQGAMNIAKLISEMSIEETDEQNFPLKYLNAFNKGETFCPVVKIHLSGYVEKGRRDPMLIEFKIGEIGVLKYYIAPMVEED
jgi:proliferating cell nuclear antigen